LTFYVLVRVPLLGVLIYGIAEASTAYLITKITEPPPDPREGQDVVKFKEHDVKWDNKQKFLSLPVGALDKLNVKPKTEEQARPDDVGDLKGRQFT
jgi:hypothetical protein